MQSARSRIRFAAGVLLGAVALRLLTPDGLVNYDTLYTLVWGRELAHGTLPDLRSRSRRRRIRSRRSAAILLSPLSSLQVDGLHGDLAANVALVRARYVSLALLGWVVFALGREWFNTAAGLWRRRSSSRACRCSTSARARTWTSRTSCSCSARCSSRRGARAPAAPVLALLALAGLLRPEAWLFSVAYLVWLLAPGLRRRGEAAGREGARRARVPTPQERPTARRLARRPPLLALAASGPAAVVPARPPAHRRPAALADRHARQRRRARPRHRPPARAGHAAAPARRDPARAGAARGGRRRRAGAALASRPAHAPGRRRRACSLSSRSACSPPRGCRSSRATSCSPARCWRSSPAPACSAGSISQRGTSQRTWWARFGALALVGARAVRARARCGADRPARRRSAAPGRRSRATSATSCATARPARRSPCPTAARSRCSRCGSSSTRARSPTRSPASRPAGTYLVPRTPKVASDYILDKRDLEPPSSAAAARAFVPLTRTTRGSTASGC